MKIMTLLTLAVLSAAATAQVPAGKWLDTTKDHNGWHVSFGPDSTIDTLILEDYEVTATHEICASINGYFLTKSNMGRYDVNFKGMRTQATFTFTTQYDAEHWAQKFCTPQSLTGIKAGKPPDLTRKY